MEGLKEMKGMKKHYEDCDNNRDKIIHMLYASYVCEFYIECIEECVKKYGEKEVMGAVKEFEKKYKKGITEF